MATDLEPLQAKAEELARLADGRPEAPTARRLAERLQAGRFLIAVVGEFKRGKSTLVNALVGLRAADPAVLDLARTLDAGRLEVLWRIRLPAALPFFFAAARVGVPLGLVGAVVEDHDGLSETAEPAGHGPAGDAVADHRDLGGAHPAPPWERKSA